MLYNKYRINWEETNMNCMKYHSKKEPKLSKEARKLVQETFTELQADALINGWGTAFANLNKKTEVLHLTNYITDTIEETLEDAMFINDTAEDIHVCPYCGSTHTDSEYTSDLEDKFECLDCKKEYHIHWDSRTWDESVHSFTVVEDITDRHNRSLFVEVK